MIAVLITLVLAGLVALAVKLLFDIFAPSFSQLAAVLTFLLVLLFSFRGSL